MPCFVFTLRQDSRVPGLYNLYFFFTSSRSTVLKKGGYCTYRIITSVRVFISIIVRRRELIIVAWIKKEGRKEGRMDECMEGRKEGKGCRLMVVGNRIECVDGCVNVDGDWIECVDGCVDGGGIQ